MEQNVYTYRNYPCTISPDNWCIFGQDKLNNAIGVLEWCIDYNDATQKLKEMKMYTQFSSLCAMRFNRPDTRIW